MNSYERVRAALLGQSVDHLPFCPFLAYVWEHYPKEIQEMGQPEFHRRIGADPMWRGAVCPIRLVLPEGCTTERKEVGDLAHTYTTTPVGSLHSLHQRSPQGNTWFLVEHPLKKPEDFKVQMWVEEHKRFEPDRESVTNHLNGWGSEGLTIPLLLPWWKSAFQQLIEHYVGTEELAYALADFPDVVEELIQVMVAADRPAAEASADCPEFEFYLTWEDSSTQNYSPAQYRKYIAPQISEWCRILKSRNKHYLQHACGHVRDLLDPMIEQGNLGVESISSEPTGNVSLKATRERVGPGFAIIGGIEPTHLLNLSGRALDGYVEQMIEDGNHGAFVLANSDSCPPGVTMEKFARVAEIARATRA